MSAMSAASFRDRVGERFHVEEVDLEWALTAVNEHDADSFSLLFEGPVEPVVAQGTYTFRNAEGETAAIFVVPVGPGSNGRPAYEAVFNVTPQP